MRLTRSARLTIGVALLLSLQPVVASESTGAPQASGIGERTGTLLQPQFEIPGKPYSRLFEAPDLRKTTPVRPLSAPLPETSQPKVVCGMTLIPIDPSIDPKIYVESRQRDTRYSIRAIRPPICK